MRRTLAALGLAALLTVGVAAPAQADTVAVDYTVTAEDPTSAGWPVLGDSCANWGTAGRNFVQVRFTVSVTGAYTFSDTGIPFDGRIALLAGSYNPADVSNCFAEVDDYETITLSAGVEYTMMQAGYNGALGDFGYTVTGPGVLTIGARVLAPTTTTLTATPNPVGAGTATTLTATVAGGSATGSVEFFDGTTSLGSKPLASGSATLVTSTLSVGAHTITATYSGDTRYRTSTSGESIVAVMAIPTTTTLTVPSSPVTVGQPAALTASVAPAATGSVEFFDGTTSLGVHPLAGGAVTVSPSTLGVGSHSITAVYSGDSTHVASTSGTATVMIAALPTATTLAAPTAPVVIGDPVALSATVSAGTGTVEFFDGVTSLGVKPVTAGLASLSLTKLGVGSHSIIAIYSGDATHAPSSSAAKTVTITAAPVATPPAARAAALPNTGVEAGTLALGGLLLLVAGALTLVTRRIQRS